MLNGHAAKVGLWFGHKFDEDLLIHQQILANEVLKKGEYYINTISHLVPKWNCHDTLAIGKHYTGRYKFFVCNFQKIWHILLTVMYVCHGDLICIDDFVWSWNASRKVTWVILTTHISHALMSDELSPELHHFFYLSAFCLIFNFQVPHIILQHSILFQDHFPV